MAPIVLDGCTLTCADVDAAGRGAAVELSTIGRDRAADSQLAGDLAATKRSVYGRSTGVGANRGVAVTDGAVEHVLRLLRSHAAAVGPVRSAHRIRAMLTVRLNQLAAGGSGVAPALLDGVLAMLTADALPQVREGGSVGTGDLSALATTALALLGEGPVSAPLRVLTPFGPSDGLGFLSSNAATLADAAVGVTAATRLLQAGIAVAALSFVAADGNAEAVSAPVELATPFPGAIAVARSMRALVERPQPPARLQDPFALRTVPQVLGPAVDSLAAADQVVAAMINAPSENPLLRPDGVVAHHGAFHALYLTQALDSAALAVARAAASSLSRLGLLLDPVWTGLPAFLADGTAAASGLMICEYISAAALGEIRAAASPAGLQTVVLSHGWEEDASFATLAAAQLLRQLTPWRTVLACELVAAVRALRIKGDVVGDGIGRMLEVCASLPVDRADRDLTEDLVTAVGLLDALAAALPAQIMSSNGRSSSA